MKGAIIFKGKYGATRQYADWLGQELSIPVLDLSHAGPEEVVQYDYLVIGAAVYEGRTLHRKWLHKHVAGLKNKKLFHFIVCGTPQTEPQKLQAIVDRNIPEILRQPSSVWFLRGRMVKKKLNWSDRMMLKIGASLEEKPEVKQAMLQDFDEVKKENIASLAGAVRAWKGRVTMAPKESRGSGLGASII
jgi:menaquinone-dependent protoporphyrinogen IX oxidase